MANGDEGHESVKLSEWIPVTSTPTSGSTERKGVRECALLMFEEKDLQFYKSNEYCFTSWLFLRGEGGVAVL